MRNFESQVEKMKANEEYVDEDGYYKTCSAANRKAWLERYERMFGFDDANPSQPDMAALKLDDSSLKNETRQVDSPHQPERPAKPAEVGTEGTRCQDAPSPSTPLELYSTPARLSSGSFDDEIVEEGTARAVSLVRASSLATLVIERKKAFEGHFL